MANEAMDRYRKFERDGIPDEVTWPMPGWPPEGIPSANEAAGMMLSLFCQYLSAWVHRDDPEMDYEPVQFYHRKIIAAYETDWYWVVVLDLYDGDEGGHNVLTAHFVTPMRTIAGNTDGTHIEYMTQEFDTMLTDVVRDGELVNLPKEGK